MEKLRELLRRIGMLRHRDQVASERQEEMQLHLDLRRQQQVESGVAGTERGGAPRILMAPRRLRRGKACLCSRRFLSHYLEIPGAIGAHRCSKARGRQVLESKEGRPLVE
jgi:hypothetical protein